MFNVRYYDKKFHPDHFKGSILGGVIRALNWIRWKLETKVQSLTLRWLSKAETDPKRRTTYRRIFALDVQQEKLQREVTSPEMVDMLQPTVVTLPREERYRDGGSSLDHAREEQSRLPTRPQPLGPLLARLASPGRSKRYTRRGKSFLMDEESVEAVPSIKDEKNNG